MRKICLSLGAALFFWGCFSHGAINNASGKAQYNQCAYCHGDQGEGSEKLQAPAIAGLPSWYVSAQLQKFKDSIRGIHPKDSPGMRMRPMAKTVKPNKIKPVSDYVAGLKPVSVKGVGGDSEKGKVIYATCTVCHGPNGEGNQAMNAPPLVRLNGWYMLTQLKNFKNGVRGGDAEKDTFGAMMAGAATGVLPDEQAMKDVIAYIRSL